MAGPGVTTIVIVMTSTGRAPAGGGSSLYAGRGALRYRLYAARNIYPAFTESAYSKNELLCTHDVTNRTGAVRLAASDVPQA